MRSRFPLQQSLAVAPLIAICAVGLVSSLSGCEVSIGHDFDAATSLPDAGNWGDDEDGGVRPTAGRCGRSARARASP